MIRVPFTHHLMYTTTVQGLHRTLGRTRVIILDETVVEALVLYKRKSATLQL